MTDIEIGRARNRTQVAHVTFSRVIASERIKLSSLPTYLVCFAAAYVVLSGFGVLTAFARILQADDPQSTVRADPATVLAGAQGVQLIVAIAASVYATSEFTYKTIQPTYLATPKRLPVLGAKAVIVGFFAFLIGIAGSATAIFGAQALLRSQGDAMAPLGMDCAVQLVVGTGLYLAAVAVLGLAIGTLLRSTAGALLTVLGVLSIVPLILGAAPFEWLRNLSVYLPSTAGLLILQPRGNSVLLDPWLGLAIAGAWSAVLVGIAMLVIRMTDA